MPGSGKVGVRFSSWYLALKGEEARGGMLRRGLQTGSRSMKALRQREQQSGRQWMTYACSCGLCI